MTQLLLETATEVCSVAVARGGVLLAEHTAGEDFRHASHLTVFIRRALAEAGLAFTDLEEIVLSDGPGSYTSLRVGAATAKGLCVALPSLRLRAVSTLYALAGAAGAGGIVLATINSRRGEVYGQLFDFRARPRVPGSGGERKGPELWAGPQNIKVTTDDWYGEILQATGGQPFTVTGPGQERVRLATSLGPKARFAGPEHCSAVHLLAPASAPADFFTREVDVAGYEPLYVNPPFVTTSKKKPLG